MNPSHHSVQPCEGQQGHYHLDENGLGDIRMSEANYLELGQRATTNYGVGVFGVLPSTTVASVHNSSPYGGDRTGDLPLTFHGQPSLQVQPQGPFMQNTQQRDDHSHGNQLMSPFQRNSDVLPTLNNARRRPEFIPAVITHGDKEHHIMTCSSGIDFCIMSVALAKQLDLEILVIPLKMQKPSFTPVGLVTPTHFCSFLCDIEGLGVKERKMSVSLVDSDDLRVFAYLHLSRKFRESLRKHDVQPPYEPGRSHAVRYHRRRRWRDLAPPSNYADSPGGVPRPMAIQGTTAQEQAIHDDPNHLYLRVPSSGFSLGNNFSTPTTASSGIFSANIASPTPGTSLLMSEFFDFDGASSVDAHHDRRSFSHFDEGANI
ncbi:hypothetical protein B0T21DRAFT_137841 [Apiosordaria backusii]|uniref:Uncharacterized protein n=1 Tax=Apiosordaria backusii TaxID=314023 RepID=A0AA40EIP1_9PEZI|nr:hypothetical protein B0T21DRAFT_137841 [Apiosordaria backusii]